MQIFHLNNIVYALILIVIAGIVNGSFALPTKHVTKWKFENIWLQYAIWAFVILPWLFMYFLEPRILQIYAATPASLLWIMVIGGFIFGSGQICFALALDMIGLGLGFVINLGLGIGLGFLLPLVFQHPDQIVTPFGLVTLIGTTFAIAGLIVANRAGVLRDREKNKRSETKEEELTNDIGAENQHFTGVILAALAGLSSASQNFIFSLTYSMQQLATNMGANSFAAANIIWPGFLLCGFIPYAGYTLYLHYKNKSFACYAELGTTRYYFFAIIMGAFWYSSLVFYSKASQLIGAIGPIVGWPVFMVLIILVSSFWGWRHKEWEGCSTKVMQVMRRGLALLVIAIIVLGYSSSLHETDDFDSELDISVAATTSST